MKLDDLKILLALEGKWTVSVNGLEYLALSASDISIEDSTLRFGKYSRKIIDLEWLRSDVVRIRTRAKARTQIDTVTFYPGERLPSGAGIRKRRRRFQVEIGRALAARLRVMARASASIEWLEWDGKAVRPLEDSGAEPETHVQELVIPNISAEVARICAMAPGALQPVPYIHGKAISVRLRGLEVARVSHEGISYPLGEPIEQVVKEINELRRHGSRHPLAHTHEERWLESNLIGSIGQILPSID